MRILCVADIHGHARILYKALMAGESHGCGVILAAGDLLFPGPEPLKTWNLLTAAHAHCVRGLSDEALATIDPETLSSSQLISQALRNPDSNTAAIAARARRLRKTRQELGDQILQRLHRLPTRFRMSLEDGGELLLVHGAPADPTVSITHDMDDDEVAALLGDEDVNVVVCGGGHVPFDRVVGRTRVICVGSLGESPTEGVAHAVMLETSSAGFDVRFVQFGCVPDDDPDGVPDGVPDDDLAEGGASGL